TTSRHQTSFPPLAFIPPTLEEPPTPGKRSKTKESYHQGGCFDTTHRPATAPRSGYWTRLKARTMTEQEVENLQKEMSEIKGKLSEFDEMKE
ncbi:hypothetical protein LINGRAHAP2_LOCUS36318, partial [Linum grandiflorum]